MDQVLVIPAPMTCPSTSKQGEHSAFKTTSNLWSLQITEICSESRVIFIMSNGIPGCPAICAGFQESAAERCGQQPLLSRSVERLSSGASFQPPLPWIQDCPENNANYFVWSIFPTTWLKTSNPHAIVLVLVTSFMKYISQKQNTQRELDFGPEISNREFLKIFGKSAVII